MYNWVLKPAVVRFNNSFIVRPWQQVNSVILSVTQCSGVQAFDSRLKLTCMLLRVLPRKLFVTSLFLAQLFNQLFGLLLVLLGLCALVLNGL